MKNRKMIQIIWWVYLLLLFVFVVVKFNGSFYDLKNRIIMFSSDDSINYNLIPLKSIGTQLKHITEWWALKNILGNIIPFMPFGFLLPVVSKRIDSLLKVFATGILSIFFIELFQFFTKIGSFDVDDIIFNIIGIMCGYIVFMLVKLLFAKNR